MKSHSIFYIKRIVKKIVAMFFLSQVSFGQVSPVWDAENKTVFESNSQSSTSIYNSTIPIHTYKGREFDLPILINYSHDGVQVNEVASNVGLGWTLSLGGEIERIVNNNPDDIVKVSDPSNCYSYVENFSDRGIWGFRDYFSLNAPGISSILRKHNENHEYEISLTDAYIDADYTNNNEWIVTDGDGTKYYFGQNNVTEVKYTNEVKEYVPPTGYQVNCNDVVMSYVTKWFLTKIVSKNKLDEYVFTYDTYQLSVPIPIMGHGKHSNNSMILNQSYSITKSKRVSSVMHNGNKIISMVYSPRQDMKFKNNSLVITNPFTSTDNTDPTIGDKLSEIDFHNFKSNDTAPSIYKKVAFEYSYFGNINSPNFLDKRLKLDALKFYGYMPNTTTETLGDQYSFTYKNPQNVPSLSSCAQDYLGLYNGQNTNTNLVFSNRTFNYEASITGILEKITYPNKGFTAFEYEQNALNGGYGIVTVPAVWNDVMAWDEVHLGSVGTQWMCGTVEGVPSSNTVNPEMSNIQLSNYPGATINTYNNGTRHCWNATTAIMRIDVTKRVQFETEGEGVYLIQQIAPCATENDIERNGCSLYYDGPYFPQANYNDCLVPTNTIVYKGNGFPNPSNFIDGGLTNTGLIEKTFSPGTYQITLWHAPDPSDTSPRAYVKIYEEVPHPLHILVTPEHTVDLDQTRDFVDGFRIKSISNYSSLNKRASKKIYKYGEGQIEPIKNTESDIHPVYGGIINYKADSSGYLNAPNIMHYYKTYVLDIDENDVCYGYTSVEKKDMVGNVNYESIYGIYESSDSNLFHYIYNYPLSKTLVFKGGEGYYPYYDIVKKTYNKDGKLILETNEIYTDIQHNSPNEFVESIHHFNTLKIDTIETTEYLNNNSKIKHGQYFSYERCDSNGGLGWCKPILTEYYADSGYGKYYIYNETNNSTIYNLPRKAIIEETTWKSNIANFSKYFYSEQQGQFLGNPVSRILISEIHSGPDPSLINSKPRFEYDTDGNMVSTVLATPVTVANNQWDSFIYGYDNRFVVAKLTGIKYSDIPTALITAIKSASNQAITPTSITAMETALNALRNSTDTNVKNAQITTYTYNPVYGMTSVTDPKGYTVYTEYDVFGRVKLTKEKTANGDLKILSENQYNTRPN